MNEENKTTSELTEQEKAVLDLLAKVFVRSIIESDEIKVDKTDNKTEDE